MDSNYEITEKVIHYPQPFQDFLGHSSPGKFMFSVIEAGIEARC
jgi:hypothetical protein